ncbi:MAG: VCBS repeat-containing protein, partial [Bacteroidetes bacterium]|nr:VCBS repeat-containing protein [Bacteroidota bacterium]
MRSILLNIGFLLIIAGCGSNPDTIVEKVDPASDEMKLFSLLKPEVTGIEFMNNVMEDDKVNVSQYINVYNGGGVAIGDVNNDGLMDIYFSGNMVSNKLYLNKGDMRFEDITESASVTGEGGWSFGVSMVDINADGHLDIYVCRAFSHDDDSKRENLLYINNGDLTFSEQAKAYGLNDPNYGTQATFFDIDLDGDLDCYVGNHPSNLYQEKEVIDDKRANPTLAESDRLFRNNGDNTFTDITIEAGILNFGYLLGLVSSDINNDGYPDIYISNDHNEPDFLYINKKDGTFENKINEYFKHISNFSM